MIKATQKFYKNNQHFIIGSAYRFGVETAKIINYLFKNHYLVGRACNVPHDYGILAQMIYNAGHGDHYETGSLWGASAIIAGMTKNEYSIRGKIYCIDPLDGYYGKGKTDKHAGRIRPSVDNLLYNLETMELLKKVVVIPKKSVPFPSEIYKRKFVSAFIDGDHWGNGPKLDIENAEIRTKKYIMVDNYDQAHTDIVLAVRASKWKLIHVDSIVALLEKP